MWVVIEGIYDDYGEWDVLEVFVYEKEAEANAHVPKYRHRTKSVMMATNGDDTWEKIRDEGFDAGYTLGYDRGYDEAADYYL